MTSGATGSQGTEARWTLKIYHILCRRNKPVDAEIKATIPFTIALKKMKFMGLNLTKYAQCLHPNIYKMLIECMKDLINRETHSARGLKEST